MKYPNRIKPLRVEAGLSQKKLADEIGVSESALQNYEYGLRDLPGDVIVKLCGVLKCTSDYLLEVDDVRESDVTAIKPTYSYHSVPMLGNVAAGEWREVYEQQGETVNVPDAFADSHPRAFAVKPAGDSMNLLFGDDDIVICDPDLEVRDKDIAVVGINGDEATIKRVYYAGNMVVLHAETTREDAYPDIAIDTKDPASPPVHMIGRVFWKTLPAKEIKF